MSPTTSPASSWPAGTAEVACHVRMFTSKIKPKVKTGENLMSWWLDFEELPGCKVCCECFELLPHSLYTSQKEARDKHASRCKLCTNVNSKLLKSIRQEFPRPPEGTPCTYCDEIPTKLVCDHDHELNMSRAWICSSCNQRYRRPWR